MSDYILGSVQIDVSSKYASTEHLVLHLKQAMSSAFDWFGGDLRDRNIDADELNERVANCISNLNDSLKESFEFFFRVAEVKCAKAENVGRFIKLQAYGQRAGQTVKLTDPRVSLDFIVGKRAHKERSTG